MPVKFEVLRIGEQCDDGPNGECGIVIVGRDGEHNTAETLHCLTAHTHSKACAQALLDQKSAEEGATSCRERITAFIAARKAAKAARSMPVQATPKKTVRRDGKDVQVDDLDLE